MLWYCKEYKQDSWLYANGVQLILPESLIAMPNLNIRLSDDLHHQLMAQCKARDAVASVVVRSLIESALTGAQVIPLHTPAVEPVSQVNPHAKGGGLVCVTVKLTESEHESIRLRKRLHGCTKSAWIVRTIRAALTRAPVLDEDATEAVKASNYQLLAIGKNINQIARRLNEKQDSQAKAIEVKQLEAIRADIDAHVSTVNTLIAAATGRGALS